MKTSGAETPEADDPDLALIRAIAQRDERAFEALYARYWRTLLAYLIQQVGEYELAEEVLQDVMLAVWKGAPGFRGEGKVRTWLLAIARKRAISARQRRTSSALPLDENTHLEGPRFFPNRAHHTAHDDVLSALDQLPCAEREIIILIFYHDLSGSEVALVIGVPEGTVRSRLRRAKVRLNKLLSEREPSDA
jgi:RNA polymerase sigma-70 factor (ECF subfamily)